MAKEIITEINISASPEKIWNILTDFEKYPLWNPFITSVKGQPSPGNRLTVRIEPPGGAIMTFQPDVLSRIEQKEFRWKGRLFITGLFDGEHVFQILDNNDGTSTFIQKERFTGILVWMINLSKTREGFELMNERLKTIAENDK